MFWRLWAPATAEAGISLLELLEVGVEVSVSELERVEGARDLSFCFSWRLYRFRKLEQECSGVGLLVC